MLGVPFILDPRLQPLTPRPDIKEHPPLRAFLYTECPMHSYSSITIPPNRLHTSLRHRSQITEGHHGRACTQGLLLYTKCPMRCYGLITIPPNMLQILSEVLMRGSIQLQTIWRVPTYFVFQNALCLLFFCDTRWVHTRFTPNIMGGFLLNKNKNSQFYAQRLWA